MKNENAALAKIENLPPPEKALPEVGQMLKAVLDKAITPESVAAVGDLVKLYERMAEKEAEKAFAVAFNALQAEMPRIQATKAVPGKDGGAKYRFAPFEDIMNQVAPLLQKHGFTVCFSNRYEGERVVETCTLQHVGGHKRSNDFAVRIGSGPPNASAAQADGAAATYAKRFALANSLNIVIQGLDNDARIEGDSISSEQAEELEHRVKMINGDVAKFLKWAGGKTFSTIPASAYPKLDDFLRSKEGNKNAKT